MQVIIILFTILGLSIFEIITSIDNAVINAEVLTTMSKRARKMFLFWGILFAVFVVRGMLPFLLIRLALPDRTITEVMRIIFSSEEVVSEAIKHFSPVLLIGGGVFLVFLFFHWLFLEPKNIGLRGEHFFSQQGAWFYAIVSVLLTAVVWFALKQNPIMAFGAVVGSTAFFIIHGFRQHAEEQEKKLISSRLSDVSKFLYLEILDTTFSIDGVVGAFAFTFSVPIILIGNGLGALVLRQITVRSVEKIKKYKYLKNGAMYSILFLGATMILHSFDFDIPAWISPLITMVTVSYFYIKSVKAMDR